MRRALWLSLALFLLVSLPGPSLFAQIFVFDLSGSQEVPPTGSTASGGCMGELDQVMAQFSVTCVHNVIGATLMHIHRGAPGVNGPIIFDLGNPSASPVTATWIGMTPADISDMLAGNLYVNVHTAGRPSGEIRGQILPRTVDTVVFSMNGSHVVPPNSTPATGSCTADLNNAATSLAIQCTHNLPSPASAHVHEAPFGSNGPIVFTFPSAASPLSGNMPMTPKLVADFAATFLYLDVHSSAAGVGEAPSPEIRGQIGTPPAAATTGTIRIRKQTSPAGGTGFNFTENISGAATFTLDDGQTKVFSSVAPGTHVVGENDPSAANHTLADVRCGDTDSSGDPFARTATVVLAAGETVDCTFRNVLTQPTDQTFVFHLSGDQEVPPVTTAERGGCMGRFDSANSRFTLVCTHDVVNATVMHIHRGAPGAAGSIAFDLGLPVSPVIATWNGMTPADVADLLAGNLYINIHTAGRPNGEIRGQILPRTVDTIAFAMNGSQVVPPDSTAATGNCTADLNNAASALAVSCTHNLPSPQAAHVHDAPFGANGPLVYTFPPAASPFSSNVPMTPRLVADFAAYFLYVEVHGPSAEESTAGPAIRGQIAVLAPPVTTGTIRILKATSPAGGTGFGFTDNVPGSTGSFTLNDAGTKTFANVPAGTWTITENDPAAAGYSLTDVSCDDTDSSGNPVKRSATIQLQAGESVTCHFTNLRSITAPSSIFVFNLSGDQEVPPSGVTERGGCFAQFSSSTSSLSLVCTHNVVGPTIMHIHRGARGVNGPVAFDLGDPTSPVEATWSNMTAQDVADLMAGNLYVNIHTSGRPGGAIRGQIVPRTVDALTFGANGAQEVPPTDSNATGNCFADLSSDAASLFVQCSHNVASPANIHLHDAPPGVDGPVVFDFPATNPFSGTAPLTPRLVADFAAGFLYVNIHSPNYTDGEIRGQVFGPALIGAGIPAMGEWLLAALAAVLLLVAAVRLR